MSLSAALLAAGLAATVQAPLRLPPSPPLADVTTAFQVLCVGSLARIDEATARAHAFHWRDATPPASPNQGITTDRQAGFTSPDGDFSLVVSEITVRPPSPGAGHTLSCLVGGGRAAPEATIDFITRWVGHPPNASKGKMIAWNVPPTLIDTPSHRAARVLFMTSANSPSTALTLQVPN